MDHQAHFTLNQGVDTYNSRSQAEAGPDPK